MTDGDMMDVTEHTEAHGDKIKGYRRLDERMQNRINNCKRLEVEVAEHWKLLIELHKGEIDMRQMAMARTCFEEGFMHMVRAIAQPLDPFKA